MTRQYDRNDKSELNWGSSCFLILENPLSSFFLLEVRQTEVLFTDLSSAATSAEDSPRARSGETPREICPCIQSQTEPSCWMWGQWKTRAPKPLPVGSSGKSKGHYWWSGAGHLVWRTCLVLKLNLCADGRTLALLAIEGSNWFASVFCLRVVQRRRTSKIHSYSNRWLRHAKWHELKGFSCHTQM